MRERGESERQRETEGETKGVRGRAVTNNQVGLVLAGGWSADMSPRWAQGEPVECWQQGKENKAKGFAPSLKQALCKGGGGEAIDHSAI